MFDFIKKRLARAVSDLKSFARGRIPDLAFTFIASFLVVPIAKIWAGADVKEEALLLVSNGLIGPVILLGLVAVFFYARAGSEIYAEQAAMITALSATITNSREQPSMAEDPRMRLGELVEFAEQECGWKIRPEKGATYESLDFVDWLGDAAAVGNVQIYGRYNPQNMSNLRNIYRVEIPVSHWVEHELDAFDAIYWGEDIRKAVSRNRLHRDRPTVYVELHVNREQAKKWLKIEGQKWRGRHAERIAQQKEAQSAFEAMINRADEQSTLQ